MRNSHVFCCVATLGIFLFELLPQSFSCAKKSSLLRQGSEPKIRTLLRTGAYARSSKLLFESYLVASKLGSIRKFFLNFWQQRFKACTIGNVIDNRLGDQRTAVDTQ